MLTLMLGHIDQLGSTTYRSECCLSYSPGLTGKGDNAAVVIGVGVDIEHHCAGNSVDSRSDCIDDLAPAAFAEVGYALNHLACSSHVSVESRSLASATLSPHRRTAIAVHPD